MKYIAYGFLLLMIFPTVSLSQNKDSSTITRNNVKPSIKFSGFVNLQSFYDSRQIVNFRDAMVIMYPDSIKPDKNGKDINAKSSFNQLAMTTRLTGTITGPDVLKAKTIALFEGDFTGASNIENNSFRLRHGYIKMNWKNREVLFGQYWHPINVPEMIPGVIGLNTGAPFHAFSRQPMIKYVEHYKKIDIIAACISQRDYVNDGPSGLSSIYIRNAVVPNTHLQLQYKREKTLYGTGVDYKILQPRLETSRNVVSTQTLGSFAVVAFTRFDWKKADIKVEALYGQNQSEHLMMGGYFVSSVDTINDEVKYSNIDQLSCWLDVSGKAKHFRPGIFLGYYKNLGSADTIAGKIFSRGQNINYLYRISPRLVYKDDPLMFAAEFEYNVAAYGRINKNAAVGNSREVDAIRILFGVFYFF